MNCYVQNVNIIYININKKKRKLWKMEYYTINNTDIKKNMNIFLCCKMSACYRVKGCDTKITDIKRILVCYDENSIS